MSQTLEVGMPRIQRSFYRNYDVEIIQEMKFEILIEGREGSKSISNGRAPKSWGWLPPHLGDGHFLLLFIQESIEKIIPSRKCSIHFFRKTIIV